MTRKGFVPVSLVRELLGSIRFGDDDENELQVTQNASLEDKLRASLVPKAAAKISRDGTEPAEYLSWMDSTCDIASDRAQAYTWREMMNGSDDGYRRSILAWAVTRPDLHGAFTRYAAGVCLAEGYGAFGSFETVTHAKAELLVIDEPMVTRALAGYQGSPHSSPKHYSLSGALKDALTAAIYSKGKPRRRTRRG